ncbi:MAG: hypothetical protein J5706_01470 [Elusimicrobiales bacterium]|nr:hypothetical protein [Elusimicrobiales bacterium]
MEDLTVKTIKTNSNASRKVVCAAFNKCALLGIPKFNVTGNIKAIKEKTIVIAQRASLDVCDNNSIKKAEIINLICMESE